MRSPEPHQLTHNQRSHACLWATWLCSACLLLIFCSLTGAEQAVFVQEGRPLLVNDVGQDWKQGDTYLEGTGEGNLLYAGKTIGEGDFRIRVRLRIAKLQWTAAAFQLGASYFGFDGKDLRLYLNGPMFGGGVSFLGEAADFISSGVWFDFEAIREGSFIRFSIDGKPVHRAQWTPASIGRIGLYPHRATMQVSHFWAEAQSMSDLQMQPRGYTIPTIDLAAETHRQVVVDRQEGQYLGHPTTLLLPDDATMLIVYPKGHGRGAIVMKRSTDAGMTWSDRLPVPDNWATSMEVPTLYPVTDPAGVRRLIMFSGLYPIRMAVSEDDGVSWTSLEPIGEFGGIVAMSDLVRLRDGAYLALFHDDGRFLKNAGEVGEFHVYKTLSRDGGLTWGKPEIVTCHPQAHLCEGGIVRSPDGSRLAILLRENSRQFNSFVVFSDDEGQTWSEPVELPAALTGDRHQAMYAPDGRLVISFRDTTHISPTKGDWVAWVGTYEDIAQGREGQYRIRLMDNHVGGDCAYPAVELLPDGTFVMTTYGHWVPEQEPFIVSVRFRLDEIDARAAALTD